MRVGLLGLGKMGLSHFSILNAHPDVELVAVCDSAEYLLGFLGKYTLVHTHPDYRQLLRTERLDAVVIATPSRLHAEMVRSALEANLHVFCEKPFCLDLAEGQALVRLAERKNRVNQVGYHYRFVASFSEMKRLIDSGLLGTIHHVRCEAYGPVVLRPKISTWRSRKNEGGGCLYDYACHAIDLLHYLVGRADSVSGTVLHSVFSGDVDDEVYTTLGYSNGMTAQIAANWSDDAYRKMSMKVIAWGSNGKIIADRQELQLYLRDNSIAPHAFQRGWNVRYTTDLTAPVWFYLRGEEYSAQIDHFIQAIKNGTIGTRSTFRSAVDADLIAAAMLKDASNTRHYVSTTIESPPRAPGGSRKTLSRWLLSRARCPL